jgi:hypothetical protein
MNKETTIKAGKKASGTVNIHGREYQTVALRVQMFREAHPDLSLVTEIVARDEDCVVMKAKIANTEGRLLATGHSEEYRKSSQINKTSALENAETSAIGRALAALGFGGTEFATANEVQNAIHQQDNLPTGEIETNGKVPGIAKIKARLNKLMLDGDKETDLEKFNALVHDCKAELTAIRDAKHQYWTGDGEDSEGFAAWIKRRRAELENPESTGFQFLMSLIDECDTVAAMQNLVAKHGDAIDALDGAEARRFQARFDEREAGLAALDKVTGGA